MYKRYVDARVPFYLNGVGMLSDADQLVKALKEKHVFYAALSDRGLTRKIADVAFTSKYYNA